MTEESQAVTFEQEDDQIVAVYELTQIALIDKGRTTGRPSQNFRSRLDRNADGYTVRYGLPDAASAFPEKWFASLDEAKEWVSSSAPRPRRVGGDVKWLAPTT